MKKLVALLAFALILTAILFVNTLIRLDRAQDEIRQLRERPDRRHEVEAKDKGEAERVSGIAALEEQFASLKGENANLREVFERAKSPAPAKKDIAASDSAVRSETSPSNTPDNAPREQPPESSLGAKWRSTDPARRKEMLVTFLETTDDSHNGIAQDVYAVAKDRRLTEEERREILSSLLDLGSDPSLKESLRVKALMSLTSFPSFDGKTGKTWTAAHVLNQDLVADSMTRIVRTESPLMAYGATHVLTYLEGDFKKDLLTTLAARAGGSQGKDKEYLLGSLSTLAHGIDMSLILQQANVEQDKDVQEQLIKVYKGHWRNSYSLDARAQIARVVERTDIRPEIQRRLIVETIEGYLRHGQDGGKEEFLQYLGGLQPASPELKDFIRLAHSAIQATSGKIDRRTAEAWLM